MRDKLISILKQNKLDMLSISSMKSIGYFTNVFIDPHERIENLIVDKYENIYLIVPKLDEEIARKTINIECEIIPYTDTENPFELLMEKIDYDVKTLGIDKENTIYSKYELLQSSIHSELLIGIDEDIKVQRLYKTEEEIIKLQESARLADICIQIAKDNLYEGMTELELKGIIENGIKKYGVTNMSFDTIVLFGENASKPHGTASDRKLKKDEFVLLDLGCYYKEYASDQTRVLSFGNISEFDKKIYNIVLKANTEAIKACKIGMKFSEIDKIARDIITEEGYGDYFTHRLGHGIGIDCHEYPDVSSINDIEIEEGMVFTIEPGIYIPGKVGVRIEDMIYMSKDGAVILTKTDK